MIHPHNEHSVIYQNGSRLRPKLSEYQICYNKEIKSDYIEIKQIKNDFDVFTLLYILDRYR